MRFRFTIARKLTVGFGILTVALMINSLLTFITLNKSQKVNEKITNVYAPSAAYLGTLYDLINNSKLLIKNWVYIEQSPNTPDKAKLINLHAEDYPKLEEEMEEIVQKWSNKDQQRRYKAIKATIRDTLFVYQKILMDRLSTFESYDDPMVMFEVQPMVEEGGEIMFYTDNVLKRLSKLIEEQDKIVAEARIDMVKSFNNFKKIIILMGIILLLSSIIIGMITTRTLVVPINYMKNVLNDMSRGVITDGTIKESNDEIGEMAVALNEFIIAIRNISLFAHEIGKENFNSDFTPLSEEDQLGLSLISMRENLKKAGEEDARRKNEDDQRNWAAHGLALYSDILRKNNDDLPELSYNIISNLVKYMNIQQGGLFIVNDKDDSEAYIELMACYAYSKRKAYEKRINMGVGLIGRSFAESEMIYLTDIPDDYMSISSGLGEEKASCILIIPLITNDKVYGVIELAAFKEIEQYKIDFVKRLAESIASTLASVKTTMNTSALLSTTQRQAEEMAQKEEEMRQNMEELQATQEDFVRREENLQKQLATLRKQLTDSKSKN